MQVSPLRGLAVAGLLAALPLPGWSADAGYYLDERESERRFYLAPMASHGWFGEDTFLPDRARGAHIALGKSVGDSIALELFGFHYDDIELRRTGRAGNIDTSGYGVTALLFPARHVLPVFGIVGVGESRHDFDQMQGFGGSNVGDINEQDSNFVDIGIGFLAPLNDFGLALRAEYRYRGSNVSAVGGGEYRFRDDIVSLGLQIPLGAKPERRRPPQPAPEPPPPAAPAPPPQPVDRDGDGVPDSNDRCPDTPFDTEVDRFGCPEGGQAPLVLEGTTFHSGSAALTVGARSRLDEVAKTLRGEPNLRLRIEGHTDSVGNAAHNLVLSRQRANAVKAYLSDRGVDPERLVTRGYGEIRPVAPNTRADGSDNPRGRATNRRVELHMIRD